MSLSTDHLNENVKQLLLLPDEERMRAIYRPRWIGYTKAKAILERLNKLLNHPKTHRMPNLLIVGDTNNGKTMIINRFESFNPANDNPNGDSIIVPTLIVQSPESPDEGRFYNSILEKLSVAYGKRDIADHKKYQVLTIFKRIGLKMLIIDELQDIMAGSLLKQRQMLIAIKHLGNELKIPIVGVGTRDAFNAIQTDPQLANRFESFLLTKWEIGNDYLSLLASFERMLPLKKPSNLINTELAIKLLNMSEGIIGELAAILNKATEEAIRTKQENISLALLDKLEWLSPSERKWKLF